MIPRYYLNGLRWIHLITSLNYVIELKKQRSNKSKVLPKENLSRQIHLDTYYIYSCLLYWKWGWRKAKIPEKENTIFVDSFFLTYLDAFSNICIDKKWSIGCQFTIGFLKRLLFDRGTTYYIWSKSKHLDFYQNSPWHALS